MDSGGKVRGGIRTKHVHWQEKVIPGTSDHDHDHNEGDDDHDDHEGDDHATERDEDDDGEVDHSRNITSTQFVNERFKARSGFLVKMVRPNWSE